MRRRRRRSCPTGEAPLYIFTSTSNLIDRSQSVCGPGWGWLDRGYSRDRRARARDTLRERVKSDLARVWDGSEGTNCMITQTHRWAARNLHQRSERRRGAGAKVPFICQTNVKFVTLDETGRRPWARGPADAKLSRGESPKIDMARYRGRDREILIAPGAHERIS